MLDRETKSWFVKKVHMDPEWLERVYLPSMEKTLERYHSQLHQACRSGSLEDIRHRQGCLDGAAEALALICGLRSSETGNPTAPGLLARIFSFGGFNV